MFKRKLFSISLSPVGIFLVSIASITMSCTTSEKPKKADQKAISDQSWFRTRPGVDRFYLAYAEFDEKFPGTEIRRGSENLLGIACYGEDKNPEAMVKLPGSGKLVAASSREKLSEFPIVKDTGEYPGAGNCVLILGHPNQSADWKIEVDSEAVVALRNALLGNGAACMGLAGAVITAAVAVQTAAAAAVPTAGTSVGGLAAISPPIWLSLVSSSAVCGNGFVGSKNAIKKFQINDNNRILFESLSEAEELAKEKLRSLNGNSNSGQSLDDIEKLLKDDSGSRSAEKVRMAAGIFNPFFVRAFNRDLNVKMEQGWGTSEKFFDAVRSLKTRDVDLLHPAKKNRG